MLTLLLSWALCPEQAGQRTLFGAGPAAKPGGKEAQGSKPKAGQGSKSRSKRKTISGVRGAGGLLASVCCQHMACVSSAYVANLEPGTLQRLQQWSQQWS